MEATTTETTEQPKKKRSGPKPISQGIAELRERGKARLAKLLKKHDGQVADAGATWDQIEALRAELGIHEDDEPQLTLEEAATADLLSSL